MTRASPIRWLLVAFSTVGLLLAVAAPAVIAQGQSPQAECPEGTTAVAKYEWDGDSYEAEFGGEVVSVSGDVESATWSSDVAIEAIVVFGGNDTKSVDADGATSGTVTNDDLVNEGGQTPEISHITFCADQDGVDESPTPTESPSPTPTPTPTPTLSPTVSPSPPTVSPTVTLTVTKVEQGDTDNTLAGATFELYADDGSGEFDSGDSQHGDACTTGDDGVCELSGLIPDSTYFLVETQAPEQYEAVGDGLREISTGEEDVSETVPNAAITDVRDVTEERPEEPAPEDQPEEAEVEQQPDEAAPEQQPDEAAPEAETAADGDVEVQREALSKTGRELNLALYAAALMLVGAAFVFFPERRLSLATAEASPGTGNGSLPGVWTAAGLGEGRQFAPPVERDPG